MSGAFPTGAEPVELEYRSGFGDPYPDWIDVAQPSAGVTASVTVDSFWWMRVVGARATLTTSASAANRFVSLDFINARSTTYMRNGAGVVIPASQTNQAFEWNRSRTVAEWAANTPFLLPVCDEWLPPGFKVQFTVDNIQAADQLSGLSLFVEKWNTGPKPGSVGVFDVMPPR